MAGRTERAAANAAAGRALYRAMTDAAGYPNGMATWEEMGPMERYWHAALAVTFLEAMAASGAVSLLHDLGLEGAYGEGDCAALLKLLGEPHSSK